MRNMQRGDADFWMMLLALALFFFVIPAVAYLTEGYKCQKRAGLMGLESDYGLLQGCMVRVGHRWAPIEYIRIIDDKVTVQGDGK